MAKKIKDENGNVYVQKKPFYKRVWFWLLVIVLIFIGIGAAGSKSGSNGGSSISNVSSSSKINQKNFDKIQISETNGTSRDEVEKMFGKKPSSTSTQSIQGTQADMAIWNGTALGSTVTVGFVNGHATSKGISGLPHGKKISMDQFNSINNGMSKADVKKTLGKPFGRTYSSIGGQSAEMWQYNGKGDLGSNLVITFTNGTVSGKSQSGLQ